MNYTYLLLYRSKVLYMWSLSFYSDETSKYVILYMICDLIIYLFLIFLSR